MVHRHSHPQWDDQELHKLFAARLPVLAIPDEFAEQLIQSVLAEIGQYAEPKTDLRQDDDVHIQASAGITIVQAPEHDQANCAERVPRRVPQRKRVPPAIL